MLVYGKRDVPVPGKGGVVITTLFSDLINFILC